MIFILSKVLLFLIKPIVWVFALLIFAAITKKIRLKKRLLLAAIIVFYVFANGYLVGKINYAYEAGYPKMQHYEVGIVLGGFSGLNKENHQIAFNWASDRLFQAMALYKKQQIDKILISSGNAHIFDKQVKEADLAAQYLKLIGIPDSAVLIENQSRNTVENAAYSLALIKKYMPKAKILVITSAWHIPRAKLIFSKYGHLPIDFYPTNSSGDTNLDFENLLIPNAGALSSWELLFKEWIGLAVDCYRAK